MAVARLRPIVADLTLALAFTAFALVLRWPLLQDVPRLTDETGEVRTALDIAFQGARPLVHNDAYRGPLWAYLLASVFSVLGPHPALPRVFAAVIGALTVGVTYLFGRAVAGRRAGVIAAALTATAFGPLAVFSHVAWSNHATPLFVLLAALFTYLGARPGRGRGVALVVAGGAWGLALHTHPAVVAPILGAGGWWVSAPERRARWRTPAPWLALGLFVATLTPMIWYNVQRPGATVTEAGATGQPLAMSGRPTELATRWLGLAGQLGRTAGAGPMVEPGDPIPDPLVAWTDRLRPLATWLYGAVFLAAWVWVAWRGPRLVACLAWATVLVLPLLTGNFVSLHDQRYIGLLVPLGAVAVGAWWADRWAVAGRPLRLALVVAALGLIVYPLLAVGAFYDREVAAGRTNQALNAVVQRLAATARASGQHVFVDKALGDVDLGGGGDPARAFVQQLTLAAVPNDRSDASEVRWFLHEDPRTTYWVIAGQAAADALGREFGLREWERGDGWWVLERPGQPAPVTPGP
jgi:4-amino-4-deoxy-L-arabinose transferase-like glycosyltransferase